MTSETTWLPADHDARRRIIQSTGENMCVEAGAGTGKTTLLVDRIVQTLRNGDATVDEIVAITFTEKAAAELSARVRIALEAALMAAGGEDERRRVEAAIRGLGHAHVETIHAFAASLLREQPFEAGLDPGFEVLDRLPGQLDFDAAWDDWVTGQMALDPPPEALVRPLSLGLGYSLVREAAQALNAHRDLLPLTMAPLPATDPDALVAVIREALAVCDSHTCIDETNKTWLEFQRLRDLHGELIALLHLGRPVERLLKGFKTLDDHRGRQDQWLHRGSAPKDALTRVKTQMEAERAAILGGATQGLVRWLEGFVAYYDARRKREGKADFFDLLVWARNLVRDNARARAYFQSRYRRIFMDEFQDTDPLQAELVIRLGAEEDPGADWRRARLRPGSLFTVGDPKQSIYRFRRADITMYDHVKRDVFGARTEALTQNFRSGGAIIDFVNDAFGKLIVEREGIQAAYIALDPDPRAGAGNVKVLDVTGEARRGMNKSQERCRLEAEAIAAYVKSQVEGGGWEVRDPATNAVRRASYRDVAILIPRRTHLNMYEEALTVAGVPFHHEGGRAFFGRQEVRELVAILRALDDSTDEVAVVAALRSPAFACSDEDLLLHREHARFDYTALADDVQGVVAESLRALRELAGRRYETSLAELVRGVVEELRLVEFAMLQQQGDQAAANIHKVIDQARAFSASRPSGALRAFVRWLRDNEGGAAEETDAPMAEETDDVVRITTIFMAKGLEFAIVILANTHGKRIDRTKVIPGRAGEAATFHIKLGAQGDGFRTPGFDEAHALEDEHEDAQDRRLLYVAATRARDHFVLPLVTLKDEKDEGTALIVPLRGLGLAGTQDVIEAATLPAVAGELPAFRAALEVHDDAHAAAVVRDRALWLEGRAALLAAQEAGLRVHTATSLKRALALAPSGGIADGTEIRRGRAMDFGIAVHEMLEMADLARPEELPALAARVAAERGLLDRVADMEACGANVLGHDLVRRALASPRYLREVAFTAPLPSAADGGLAEGRIDLLFLEEGAIRVVDFKTDRVSAAASAARAREYREQALIYAWAAHRTTGLPVGEVAFLFARTGHVETIPVDEAFLAEAEALLRAPATPV